MRKQLVILGIGAILIIVGISGCNQVTNMLYPEKDKFIGTWINTTITPESSVITIVKFYSNGTCKYDIVNGTWDVKDSKLVIVFSNGYSRTYDYVFSNNDKILSITSPAGSIPKVFIKQ